VEEHWQNGVSAAVMQHPGKPLQSATAVPVSLYPHTQLPADVITHCGRGAMQAQLPLAGQSVVAQHTGASAVDGLHW
jgi:hypothetical protein